MRIPLMSAGWVMMAEYLNQKYGRCPDNSSGKPSPSPSPSPTPKPLTELDTMSIRFLLSKSGSNPSSVGTEYGTWTKADTTEGNYWDFKYTTGAGIIMALTTDIDPDIQIIDDTLELTDGYVSFQGSTGITKVCDGLFNNIGQCVSFCDCSNLKTVGANCFNACTGAFDTLFANCTSLEYIDMSSSFASIPVNPTSTSGGYWFMFQNCHKLKNNIADFTRFIESNPLCRGMFANCSSLTGNAITDFIEHDQNVNYKWYGGCFAGCTSLNDYDEINSLKLGWADT